MSYPPGPTEAPAVQTARWIARPIAFLEDCRRRFGPNFSVRFIGFTTPTVQAITLEVILRAVFGVTDPHRRARLREMLPRLLNDTASGRLQLRVLVARRLGRSDPLADLRELARAIDDLLFAEIAERRAA